MLHLVVLEYINAKIKIPSYLYSLLIYMVRYLGLNAESICHVVCFKHHGHRALTGTLLKLYLAAGMDGLPFYFGAFWIFLLKEYNRKICRKSQCCTVGFAQTCSQNNRILSVFLPPSPLHHQLLDVTSSPSPPCPNPVLICNNAWYQWNMACRKRVLVDWTINVDNVMCRYATTIHVSSWPTAWSHESMCKTTICG